MASLNSFFNTLLGRNETPPSPALPAPTRSDIFKSQSFLMLGNHLLSINPALRSGGLEQAFRDALKGAQSSHHMSDSELAEAYSLGIAAFACVQVRARLVASVPIIATLGEERLTPELVQNPAVRFMNDSEAIMGKIETALSIWGKNYLHKRRNTQGYPVVLEWVNPALLRPVVSRETGMVQHYLLGRQQVPTRDILFNHTFNPNDPHDGISPYEVAMKSVYTEGNLMQMASTFFGNNARPDGVLTPKETDFIDEDDIIALEKRWNAMFKGIDNQYKTAVLPSAWEYQTITPPPTDLAMNDLTQIVRSNIVMAFGIHPILIGLGTGSDPLSAQNTYREAWFQHVEYFAIPEVNSIINLLNEHWLAEFDKVLNAPVRLAIDHEKINSMSRATAERSQTSMALYGTGLLDHTESREYIGKTEDETGFRYSVQDTSIAWNDGAITFNEYRKRLGRDELEDGRGEKFIYEIDPRQSGQVASPFSGFNLSDSHRLTQGVRHMNWNKNDYLPRRLTAGEILQSLMVGIKEAKELTPPLPTEPEPDDAENAPPATTETNAVLSNHLDELRKWRQKQRYHGKRCTKNQEPITPIDFETDILNDDIQSLIRGGLAAGWYYGHVFDVATSILRQDEPIPDEPFGATPAEYESYWQNLDELELDLGQEWLAYLAAVSPDALQAALASEDGAFSEDVFSTYHENFINNWVGTLDNPGTLLRVTLAGMAKGNDILNAMIQQVYPERVDPLSVQAQEAYDYALQYAGKLIKDLDDTTRNKISAIIAKSIEEGWDQEKLIETLETVLLIDTDTPSEQVLNRARLISDSETATAYNAGAQSRWENAGAQEAIWQTVNDGKVCQICRRLHGKTFTLTEGIYSPDLGKQVRYTAHGRCRCFQRPDINSIDLDALLEGVV